MNDQQAEKNTELAPPLEISDNDVYEAMKKIGGYLDITPGDFKQLYRMAYHHAISRLIHSVKAGDIMTREVIFVSENTLVVEVAETMAARNISGVPVVDTGKKVVGVISERDFVFHMGGKDLGSFMSVVAHCLKSKACVALPMRHQIAEDIMSRPAITAREETPVSEVSNLLTRNHINRIPVVDQGGKLVGIIARADIVQTSCTVVIPRKS